MLINAEKHLDIFKKIVEIPDVLYKKSSYSAELFKRVHRE